MTQRTRKGGAGMIVHAVQSPQGQAILARRGLTVQDLAQAIARFQAAEGTRIGTLIGVTDDGIFGSTREGWRPDQPDAYAEPLLAIPWVQALELPGRVTDGTTWQFLDPGGRSQGSIEATFNLPPGDLVAGTLKIDGFRRNCAPGRFPVDFRQ